MEKYFAFPGSLRLSHYFHLRLLPLKLECGLLFVDHKWWWKLEVELGLEWLVQYRRRARRDSHCLINILLPWRGNCLWSMPDMYKSVLQTRFVFRHLTGFWFGFSTLRIFIEMFSEYILAPLPFFQHLSFVSLYGCCSS